MEEETKSHLGFLDKRIEDIKSFITLIIMAASAVFGALALVFTWNVATDKADLRQFKTEIKEDIRVELQKITRKPKIEILNLGGKTVEGKLIDASVDFRPGVGKSILLPIVIKNIGDADSGEITVKAYTSKPIILQNPSTDDSKFSYEVIYYPGHTGFQSLPGGLSSMYDFALYPTGEIPPAGQYPIMLKIYYGKGQVYSTKFIINLKIS